MDILQAIESRHSVRDYTHQIIRAETAERLQAQIDACNQEGSLHIQMVLRHPEAFEGLLARYGQFHNVHHYICLVGRQPGLEERIGYYGERIALTAQQLGLNTCWVGLTYSRRKAQCIIEPGEKLVCVLALGYGTTAGKPHRSKPISSLCRVEGPMPAWFRRGMEAALLAPTAMNQQKFCFTLKGNEVTAEAGWGPYTQVDLGIAKYHFECGAGSGRFRWR